MSSIILLAAMAAISAPTTQAQIGPAAPPSTLAAPASVDSGAAEAAERLVRLLNSKRAETAEGKQLLVGELTGLRAPAFELPFPDKVLASASGAVARLPSNPQGEPDLYLYLRRSGAGWEAHAIRALALTAMHAEIRRHLQAKPDRTRDEEQTLRNAELTLASDKSLAAWFAAHRSQLDRARTERDKSAIEAELKGLGITALMTEEDRFVVLIGGMVDNSVGFLFTDKAPPPIEPSEYIWVEPLGDGWYLFKTT